MSKTDVEHLVMDATAILNHYLDKDITAAGYTEICDYLTLIADAIRIDTIPQGYDTRTDALRSYYFTGHIDATSSYHGWEDIFDILSSFGEDCGDEEPNAFLFRQ
jgi:hypothetical protein